MEFLFSRNAVLLWALVLALALFWPLRRLIWVLTVRRAAGKLGELPPEAEQQRLKRRAGLTAGLLAFVFALLYSYTLFSERQ